MGILDGNSNQEPLHYGEIFSLWSFLNTTQGNLVKYQTFLNHVGDQDLRNFIENLIQNEMRTEIQQLETILKEHGVELPPSAPERPNANPENIPAGARFNDPEVASMISMDITAALVACSQAMGQSTREDIGMMFDQFHSSKVKTGGQILQLNKDKGWLIHPPLHAENLEPAFK